MSIAEVTSRTIALANQTGGLGGAPGAGRYFSFRPGTSGGLKKQQFESDSIRTDEQYLNPSHGMRSGEFNLQQELQLGGHQIAWEAALRAPFVAGATVTATTISINSGTRTITRSSGSFITSGFRNGDIVRATGFTNASNNGKNFRVFNVAALTMVYQADPWISGITTEAAGASVTIAVPGSTLIAPLTGHVKTYLNAEDWHTDLLHSTLITDAIVDSFDIKLPPNGNGTVDFKLLGRDAQYGSTQILSTAAASSTRAYLAGPNGILRYGTADSAVITDLNIKLDCRAEVKGVVGANISPDVFRYGMRVSGSFTALFDAGVVLTDFDDGLESTLYLWLFEDSSADSDFLIFKLPRVKVNGADKSVDGPAVTLQCDFTAGVQTTATNVEQTSISITEST